ncbi:GGDEF domain-containing protein [Chryseomicrobium palamuruense]|uniref:GGDEF domain-containing protein n=1 Tax=Chryseomicrobium palamuruense TaxID=682973 RepID=A0ABV8UWR3_9BACL
MQLWKEWHARIPKDPQSVIDQALQLLETKTLPEQQQGEVYFLIALAYRYLSKMAQCLNYAYQAEQVFQHVECSEGLAKTYNLIGVVYFYNGFYEKALKQFFQAKDIAKANDYMMTLCRIENNIGEVYRETEDFLYAKQHYQQALDHAEHLNELFFQAIILENLGQLHMIEDRLEKAYDYFIQSYQILIHEDDFSALADIENKLGSVFWRQGNTKKADYFYQQAYRRLSAGGNQLYLTEVILNLSDLVSDYESSYEELLLEAERIAAGMNAHQQLKKVYKRLSEYYERNKEFEAALNYFKHYHKVEQVIEASVVRGKLELLRVELLQGTDHESLARLNEQLTYEIDHQKLLYRQLKKSNEQLSEEIYTDELTKILNRKGLFHALPKFTKELHLFLLLDVDYFKKYNDVHGHVKGDEALKLASAAMQLVIDQQAHTGIVSRMGGEEFLCIVSVTEPQQANNILYQLKQEIEKIGLYYTLTPSTQSKLTISGGGLVTSRNVHEHFEYLYHQADQLLYDAKLQGRNRYIVDNDFPTSTDK